MYRPWVFLVCALASVALMGRAESGQTSSLPAPVQISPVDKARLHGFPRKIVFEWAAVHGANGYGIEVNTYGGGWFSEQRRFTHMEWLKDHSLTFEFTGDQPGAWRVWAMDKKGQPGHVSPWSLFTFGAVNSVLPTPPADTPPDFSRLPNKPQTSPPFVEMRPLPVFDPVSREACSWPPPVDQAEGVKTPKAIYTPEPEFTNAARKAKKGGDVMLALNLGDDGLVKRACILRASRDDLGMAALKTARTWRFEPAQKDGKPIPYILSTEVSFHLY